MNNFTIIYKILRKLETAMGLDEFSLDSFDLGNTGDGSLCYKSFADCGR